MKRLSFIVMAGLIALGLTQCKKNEPTNNDTEGVKITLNINNGNGGGRLHIEEGTSTTTDNPIVKVLYDIDDVIYVGSNGSYVGYLTCTSADSDGSTFTGTISSSASTSHPLQFIYLGGHTATENRDSEFRSNTTGGSFTFSLEDQSLVLHVVSTAASSETFDPATPSYTLAGGKMRNKCALVKFTFNEGNFSSAEEATINGVYNQLNIGFDGTVSITGDRGDIATFKSTTSNAVHFAVVPATEENLSGDIYIEGYEGTYSIEAPSNNAFIQLAVTLTSEPESNFTEKPFTIGTGKTVYFSRSNAHFGPSGWYLAKNQYDYEETWFSNEPVSHFAWGTWGNYSNPNTPSNIIDNSDYYHPKISANGYTYISNYTGSFDGPIPGETGTWRVMTQEEWNYLFNGRTVNSGQGQKPPYGFGNVYGRNGLIVLPDDWDGSADSDFRYGTDYGWPNVYRGSKWEAMELAGAVFLPAAGYRLQGATTSGGNFYHSEVWHTDILGGYWSSTKFSNSAAYLMYFENNQLNTARTDYAASYGFCVRFVKAAN